MADGRLSGFYAGLFRLLLSPVALCYRNIQIMRAALYRRGILRSYRLSCPVISVGNLTVGGTGKTPATAWIARRLLQQGLRVAVLSRGYGGSLEGNCALVSDGQTILLTPDQCGDEPYLLASTIPGLMVVIGSDRYRAGLLAQEALKPDAFLLDDGFQHLRLQRDLNILLLDGQRPFGNGWTLPSGLLREPRSALARADLVLFTRCHAGQIVPDPGKPYCCSEHRLTSFNRSDNGDELSPAALQGSRVLAFAGIADPAAFFEGLEELGIPLVASCALPDHEPYQEKGLEQIDRLYAESKADWLITTEKDGVKLRSQTRPWSKRLLVAPLNLRLPDNGKLLLATLDKLLSSRR